MPKGDVTRWKEIRCRVRGCGAVIKRFDRSKYPGWHVPTEDIFKAIRSHRKRNHQWSFRRSIAKGVKTRRGR